VYRINYCNLWVAIIHADEEKIKDYARVLCGPDASYQLFASMLTARAWERFIFSLSSPFPLIELLPDGTARHLNVRAQLFSVKELDRPITQEEKKHLMLNAAVRFKEINDILATVPSRTFCARHFAANPTWLTLPLSNPMQSSCSCSRPSTPSSSLNNDSIKPLHEKSNVISLNLRMCPPHHSDLLRALNRDLGHPVNTYAITARFCVQAVLAHSLELGSRYLFSSSTLI
jgi:hypothetical protein